MKKIIIALLILLALTTGLLFYIKITKNADKFSAIFFNIGQGDAALIKFGNGEKMLVDCGPDRKILSKLGRALPFYDRTVDYLLVTHPDLDHYGGCVDALKRYKIKEIILNGREKSDSYYAEWDKAVHSEGAVLKIINGPQERTIAGATLEFLAPDPSLPVDGNSSEGNNASIVFRLTNVSTTILFTGDMEEPLEKALVYKYCSSTSSFSFEEKDGMRSGCPALKSDILKVGHHGSDSSSGEEFLEAVRPEKAIISVGKNSFGHPSLRVLKKLERAGAQILRTDQLGDLSF